ncbi:MAG: hypothetical protein ACI80V_000205 [Rhodothermales bacterium]|jgi:hypothetical protein
MNETMKGTASPSPEALDLAGHFSPTTQEAWRELFLRDLGIDRIEAASTGLDGDPPVLPYYTQSSAHDIGGTAGWRYADFVDLGPAGSRDVPGNDPGADGAADLVIFRLDGPFDGLDPSRLAHAGPHLVWATGAGAADLSGLDRESLILDPMAEALRHNAPVDFGLSDFGGSLPCYVDLTAWDARAAPNSWLAAAAFSSVSEWMVQLTNAGVPPERAASRIRIIIPLRTEFFPSIALQRAIRLGTREVLAHFGAVGCPPHTAVASEFALSPQDTYTNLLRSTTMAAAAAVGGADVLCLLPYDHHAGGSERGRRLSRNISHLLRYEGHLGLVADAGAGSHYVETLTEETARLGWDHFKEWESRGGLARMLSAGEVHPLLEPFHLRAEARVASAERVVVGLNRFQPPAGGAA